MSLFGTYDFSSPDTDTIRHTPVETRERRKNTLPATSRTADRSENIPLCLRLDFDAIGQNRFHEIRRIFRHTFSKAKKNNRRPCGPTACSFLKPASRIRTSRAAPPRRRESSRMGCCPFRFHLLLDAAGHKPHRIACPRRSL